jgi:Acetyltransferase (GNAT) domain
MQHGDHDRAGLVATDPAIRGPAVNEWVIRPCCVDDLVAWKRFLADSNNGTLFHDLDFLAYHPPGRYDFRHLTASRANRIEALIPGALTTDGIFVSLAGASIGGPVVKKSMPVQACVELIQALQVYAKSAGWQGIEITLPPPVYYSEPDQVIEFALHRNGFELVHRSIPLLIPLDRQRSDHYQHLFRQSQRSYVRACRRKGVIVTEAGVEGLGEFLELFAETYVRLQARPTHTPEEINSLFQQLPGCLRIWSANLEGTTIASVLMFVLNRNVCTSFYICDRTEYRGFHGITVLLAEAADTLAARGFRYLDLGPSASTAHFNQGVVNFKESLGARAFCRDRWRWNS